MKIIVDRALCESHGQCEYVAPDVFHLEEDGELTVTATPSPSQLQQVQLAAQVCPMLAIRIEEPK